MSIFLQMNTWWYIHTATLYQLSCWWTRADIYIPQLYINFPSDEHVMIYTYLNFISIFRRWADNDIYIPQIYINFPADEHAMIYTHPNFISSFLQMNTWWYIHTATLYQFSCRWTGDDLYILQLYINFPADEHLMIYIYIPQLYINFPAGEHVMIYTYRIFISIFLQRSTWWYIHTATLYQLSCRWTPDDIYIPELYINFPADEHVMIYTYRNFISTFLQVNTWWYIHTGTLYQLSCRWTRDDIYIPQLYINFFADEQVIISTYHNFISTFLQMNTWWYIHTATLYQLSWRWTRHDIYIPQLYMNFPADEHVMIYTYRNFISSFLQMNSWWYIHTATLYQFSWRWTRDDIQIPQLYINFPSDEHLMIYTYRNFIPTFLHKNTW